MRRYSLPIDVLNGEIICARKNTWKGFKRRKYAGLTIIVSFKSTPIKNIIVGSKMIRRSGIGFMLRY